MIAANTGRNYLTIGFCSRKLHINSFLPRFHRSDQIGQSEIGIRSYDKIYMMVLDQIIFYTFCHAAQHTDNQIPTFVFLHRMEKLQTVQNLLFCIVANRTGIHKYSVRFIQCFAYMVACHLHNRSNHFTISNIHLASVGFNKQFFVLGISCRFKVCSCCFFHIFSVLWFRRQRYGVTDKLNE